MKIDDTFIEILDVERRAGNTVFLAGEPGIGKTSICKWLARNNHSEHFIVQVNQLADKADLTGARLMPTPDGASFEQKFFAHHKVRAAVQYATDNPRSQVFLVLDEINRTTPDVTSGALSISTERELGDQRLPDNVVIMVTGNTKGNVVALDDASLSRFVVYNVEPDAPTLIAYLDSRQGGSKPMNPWVKAVLVANPEMVFQRSTPESYGVVDGSDDDDDAQTTTFESLMDAGEEMLQLTTPRTIEGLSDWLDEAPQDMLMKLFQTAAEIGSRTVTMLHEVIEGHVGNTPFAASVVGEIAKALSSGAGTPAASRISAPKPGCWDDLKAATTQNDLDALVAGLNDTDRSGALVYAIHDRSDNSAILQQLMAHGTVPVQADVQVLVTLLNADRYDTGNLDTVMTSSATGVENVRQLATALGKA